MVPILEVMYEPALPAIIMEINVGANSSITDCLVANAISDLGISGLVRFRAVCMATTPPIKNEINATMPNEPIIRSSISLKMSGFITDHLVGLLKTSFIIRK